MRSNHRKSNRNYQIKKRGVKDDYIDKQITAIHQAIVEKLIVQPELIVQVQQRLDDKREQGSIGYGAYITWTSILELYDDQEAFRQGILEDTQQMKRLRRTTPFVGVLTEQERKEALESGAIATIKNTDVLFL
ncbi:hypothetical protein HII17_07205 [Thalassotalea sp. M1531]|uniref:Uncharacterized protein n=1 Tax=Thalassotalea algicola TaxID=2716224 RepID=A0A7Y0LDW1_9GAMM|nr:hypothetical protein [Thalassotalea algicola]NMP31345.1 hypothetical protein [Thalassotalea algicola]